VLITDTPRVLADATAQLNATEEQRENEKNRQNTEANFTSPRRNYWMAQEQLRDHSPRKQETETRFDSFQHFVFETVIRLFAPRVSDSRVKREGLRIPIRGVRLPSYRVNHSVHRSPCALHDTVRDVLSGNSRAFRHVPRRAGRPSLNAWNAANAKTECEKY
jgi:hypothetical protein